jgi:leucyl aminopeptidase
MINIKLERKTESNIMFTDKYNMVNGNGVENASEYFVGLKKDETNKYKMVRVRLHSNKKDLIKSIEKENKETNDYVENIKMSGFKFKKNTFLRHNNNEIIVGSKGVKEAEDWRDLGFKMIKEIRKNFPKCKNVRLERVVDINSKQFFEGIFLADFKFEKYKTVKTSITDINFLVSQRFLDNKNFIIQRNELLEIIKEAKQKVSAQNLARRWVNTTPEEANSETISEEIVKKFKFNKEIKVEVYNQEKLEKLKMNGQLTVNRASKFEAKVVKITFEPKNFNRSKNKVILGVGKGLTYDSGGLSIKPTEYMTNMKSDKGGAIALYGFADILAKRSGDNKVVLYLAFAENMINQDSYRPDDVVVQKNGVTAHIKNTDAEGRVVIHDSLTLAQEENPDFDEIFSIATLTGAAVYQFGNEAAGMVSKNEKLFEPFYEKGKIEDEVFCEARLHKFMLNGINDEVADISNTGTPNQGCQKAGLYLMSSIQKKNIKKYIHLDIAGPTFVEKPFGTNPIGATGFGVRTLFEVYK